MNCVVRLDNLQGTVDGSKLVSFQYKPANTATAIDNGHVVVLDSLLSGEKELWKAVAPSANDGVGKLILVATPELNYDERKPNLDDFTNAAGANCRGYLLQKGDMFAVTAEAFTSGEVPDLTTNVYITIPATTYFTRASAATYAVLKLAAIETEGGYTYYVLRVL